MRDPLLVMNDEEGAQLETVYFRVDEDASNADVFGSLSDNNTGFPLANGSTNYTNSIDQTTWPFSIDMQHLVFLAMCLCLVSVVLLVIVVLKLRHIYLRWRRRRRAGPRISIIDAPCSNGGQTPQCNANGVRRGLLSRMLARIEEFDSLTPLMVTPNSLSDDDAIPVRAHARHGDRLSASNTTSTPVSFRGSPRRRPRCAGKITLFPLASNARRAESYIGVSTAESTSDLCIRESNINIKTTNSNNTIPKNYATLNMTAVNAANNNVVFRNPFEDLDLVSIDRTSGASTLDRRSTPNDLLANPPANKPQQHDGSQQQQACLQLQSYSNQQHQQALFTMHPPTPGDPCPPLSALPSPASTDILIPISELQSSVHMLNVPSTSAAPANKFYQRPSNGTHRYVIKRESSSVDSLSSNLSSPMDSSICGDTGSPLDTTGSLAELSDSVYMASESDTSDAVKMVAAAGRIYSTETGATQRWYAVTPSGDSDKSEPDLSTFEFEAPAVRRYVLHRIEEESEDAAATNAATSASLRSMTDRSAALQSQNGNFVYVEQYKDESNGKRQQNVAKCAKDYCCVSGAFCCKKRTIETNKTAMAQEEVEMPAEMDGCVVCYNFWKPPIKMLKCGHSFCCACLTQLQQSVGRFRFQPRLIRFIRCPTCRSRTDVPEGGVAALPNNFALENVMPHLMQLLRMKMEMQKNENDSQTVEADSQIEDSDATTVGTQSDYESSSGTESGDEDSSDDEVED